MADLLDDSAAPFDLAEVEDAVPESVKRQMRLMLDLRRLADETEKAAKDAKKRRDDQEDLVHQMLKGASITVDLGEGYGRRQFIPTTRRYNRIIDENKLIEHFEGDATREGIVTKAIRKAALNDVVKDALDHKRPLPPGVDFWDKRGVRVANKNRG